MENMRSKQDLKNFYEYKAFNRKTFAIIAIFILGEVFTIILIA